MYRTFVILRHTFKESIVQPIYSLLLALGAGILIIFMALPFFTFGEDTIMFKAVGLDMMVSSPKVKNGSAMKMMRIAAPSASSSE